MPCAVGGAAAILARENRAGELQRLSLGLASQQLDDGHFVPAKCRGALGVAPGDRGVRGKIELGSTLRARTLVTYSPRGGDGSRFVAAELMGDRGFGESRDSRRAVVMITHDLEEAIALGDRVVVLAAGPKSRVIESFPVDLERPRNVAEIKLDPKFMTLYRDIWASLRGEVEKSYASR